VFTEDISLLGNHYGVLKPDAGYLDYLDVGPTTTHWVDGLPAPDGEIGFEDLVIFAINYGRSLQSPQLIHRPAADPSAAPEIVLERPESVSPGADVTTRLLLHGRGALRAISTRLAWDPAVVQPTDQAAGSWLAAQGGVAFSPKPGTVDAAALSAAGMSGEGELATVTFKVLAAGDPKIHIEGLDARDNGNHAVTLKASEQAQKPAAPAVTRLEPASPNPFRQTAALNFSLSQAGSVQLAIYSVNGQRVRTLVDEARPAGEYRQIWDGRDDRGNQVHSGVYYARMVAGGSRFTRPVVYLK